MNGKRGSLGRNPLDWIRPTTFKTVIEDDNTDWKKSSNRKDMNKKLWLIPLSARTENSLKMKMNKLAQWIQKHNQEKIEDISYMLSVGRSHFEYRSAWLVESIEELEEILLDVEENEHFGSYTLGMTPAKKQQLKEKADTLVKRIGSFQDEVDNSEMMELKECYEQGAEINWKQLFAGMKVHKISLPGYQFDRSRYWAEPGKNTDRKISVEGIHPMVDRNCSTFFKQAFQKTFYGQEFYLRDHCVGKEKVLPGVAYLELVRAVAEQSNPGQKVVKMKDIVWYNPIHMGAEDKAYSIEIRLTAKEEESTYEVFTLENEKASILNGKGTMLFDGSYPESNTKILDIEQWKTSSSQIIKGKRCYENFSKRNLNLGESFQSIQNLYIKDGELLGEIKLPENLKGEYAKYMLHPVIIDGAMEAVIGLILSGNEKEQELSLPFALDEITIYGKPSEYCYSFVQKSSIPAWEGVEKFDVMILDACGRLMVSLKGCSFKKVQKQNDVQKGYYYKPVWKKESPLAFASKEYDLQLRMNSVETDVTHLKEKLRQVDSVKIVYTAALHEEGMKTGSHIFKLIKQLTQLKVKAHIQFIYAWNRKEVSCQEGVGALLKTAVRENGKLSYQMIGIEQEKEHLIEDIVRKEQEENVEVKYSQGERYRKHYEMFSVNENQTSHKVLNANGVYVITGGAGKIGMIFARRIAASVGGTIILTGRSSLTEAIRENVNELCRYGAKAEYIQMDVTSSSDVEYAVEQIIRKHGKLDGIIHAAGITRDGFILDKTEETFHQVINTKISGMYHLVDAVRKQPIQFMVLCSSIAAINGNVGQADYAYANGVMDAFAQSHRELPIVSINWPLWENGGMRVDQDTSNYFEKSMGLHAISDESGIKVFLQAISMGEPNFLYVEGERQKIEKTLGFVKATVKKERSSIKRDIKIVQSDIKQIMKEILRIDLSNIEPDKSLDDYGFNSLNYVDFARKIQEKYDIDITPADFYEYPTFRSLTNYLYEDFGETIFSQREEEEETESSALDLQESVVATESRVLRFQQMKEDAYEKDENKKAFVSTKEPIAIIGMNGVFPGSENLTEYWNNLKNNRNMVSEVPADRWDVEDIEKNQNNIGKPISKWGGFIKDIDKFDGSFFGISPREANLMDPQQRLFLQTVYKTIEDAGYKPEDLSESQTGVFVGVSTQDYSEMFMREQRPVEAYLALGTSRCVLPNRLSYLLNLKGPSMSIDTACSSSLVALHEAVRSIRNGECTMAIASGVNVMIAPTLHEAFSKSGMLSIDGKCKTFDASADGYVRGEGVGAILMKPLSQARKDGDMIYAIIRGSAVNHNGKSNTLTSPSKKAQEEVLLKAYEDAGIDGTHVTYCEAHGTGTSLGDPIEMNALKAAFEKMYKGKKKSFGKAGKQIGVGSVKSNIGHLEAASGIAGIIKVVLAMNNGMIPGNPHFQNLNPYIDLQETPFYIAKDTKKWDRLKDENGKEIPRIAGVSSFGFGGMNAHIVIEEEMQVREAEPVKLDTYVVPVSAKEHDLLKEYVKQMLDSVKYQEQSFEDTSSITDWKSEIKVELAKILDIEAEELEDSDNLIELGWDPIKLNQFRQQLTRKYKDLAWNDSIIGDSTVAGLIDALADKNYCDIRKAGALQGGYAREFNLANIAYTMQNGREAFSNRVAFVVHTMEEFVSTMEQFLEGQEGSYYYQEVNETVDDEQPMVFLEFQKAAEAWCKGKKVDWNSLYGNKKPIRISLPTYPFRKERHWLTPLEKSRATVTNVKVERGASDDKNSFEVKKQALFMSHHKVNGKETLPGVVYLSLAYQTLVASDHQSVSGLQDVVWLKPCQDDTMLNISIEKNHTVRIQSDIANSKETFMVCQKGMNKQEAEGITIADFKENSRFQLNQKQVYRWFKETGIEYGPLFQSIQTVWDGKDACLSYLEADREYKGVTDLFAWNPSMMDGALQTLAILHTGYQAEAKEVQLPYAADEVQYYKEIPEQAYALVKRAGNQKYNVSILDVNGEVCIYLKEVAVRTIKPEKQEKPEVKLSDSSSQINFLYQSEWKPVRSEYAGKSVNGSNHILYTEDTKELVRTIENCIGTAVTRKVQIEEDREAWLEQFVTEVKDNDTIYFLGGMKLEDFNSSTVQEMEKCQEQSVIAFFYLLQRLQQNERKNLDIIILTNRGYSVFDTDKCSYYGSMLAGLALSAQKEFANMANIHIFDLNISKGDSVSQETAIRCVLSSESKETVTAVRLGTCYQNQLKKKNQNQVRKNALQNEGVYVILGGTGGIGMELASYLANSYQAHVVLVSRSGLKEQNQDKYQALLANGADIQIRKADITDLDSMQQVMDNIEQQYGKIHGIVHAAIVLKDQTIMCMDESKLKEVMEPKVTGAWVLKKVLEGRKPDFVLFFSSIQSIVGNYGQANYCAASAFEDAFATAWNEEVEYPVCLINWGFWGSVGIVANEVYNKLMKEAGLLSIEPHEGIEVIRQVLSAGDVQTFALKATDKFLNNIGVQSGKSEPRLMKAEIEYILKWNRALEVYAQQKVIAKLKEKEMFLDEGEIYDVNQLKDMISPSKETEHVFQYLLHILQLEGYIQLDEELVVTTDKVTDTPKMGITEYEETVLKTYPEIKPHVRLLNTCIDHYDMLYQKKMTSVELLFSGERKSMVADIYKGNRSVDYFNDLMAWVVKDYISKERSRNPEKGLIRILEIGAGTGATSQVIFRELTQSDQVEYVFTDIGNSFVQQAKRKYSSVYPFVKCELLNIEENVEKQGFQNGSFDLVLATNVLHATKDMNNTISNIASLLMPGGQVVINELTSVTTFTTCTFGLLEGWWLSADKERRMPFSPLLSKAQWEQILKENGFASVKLHGASLDEENWLGQCVITGEMSQIREFTEKPAYQEEKANIKEKANIEEKTVVTYKEQLDVVPEQTKGKDQQSKYKLERWMEEKVTSLVAETLEADTEQIMLEQQFSDYGVDSIIGLELVQRINDEFKISLKTMTIFDYGNIKALSQFILREFPENIAQYREH